MHGRLRRTLSETEVAEATASVTMARAGRTTPAFYARASTMSAPRIRAALAALLLPVVPLTGCAGTPDARPRFVPPPPFVRSDARPSGASIGLVLTGGGAFGAWEAGAVRALFDLWLERYGEDPPLRVVAGTSTGALLAPFVLLGRESMIEAGDDYTEIETGDLLAPKLAAILPFPLFATLSASAYGAGFPGPGGGRGSRLYRMLFER